MLSIVLGYVSAVVHSGIHQLSFDPGNCSEFRIEKENISIKCWNSIYPSSVTSASAGANTRVQVQDQKIATVCVTYDKVLSKNIQICRP